MQGGFAALVIVLIVGFLAVFFVMNSTVRGWTQDKSIAEAQAAAQVRLRAISCVEQVKLRLFTNQYGANANNLAGTYYGKGGYCNVEIVSRQGEYFYISTNAESSNIKVSLQSEVRASDLKIISIQEF